MNKDILTADEIVEESKKRVRAYAARDLQYDMYLSYYFGKQNRGEHDFPLLIANAQGRPLLRQIGESLNTKRTYSTQRLSPVIDDYQALVGRMPTVRVEAPTPDEAGEQKAELQTKYLYSTYELCDMGLQQGAAGFFLAGLGDAVYLLHPEPDERRPVWEVISPRHCYPAFRRGYRRFQVYDMIIGFQLDHETIEREYDVETISKDQEDCQVMTYISPSQRTVVIGTRRPILAADLQWDLDFCPAQWAWNKLNGEFANSDIAQSMDQQDFIDFLANLLADGLVYRTYPIIGVKNPLNVGEVSVGPDAPPVPMQGDGDIVVREVQGDVKSAMELMQQTLSDMNATTGSSSVRQEGQMKSSITTGRAVHAVQGPQSTRIDMKQQALSTALQRANEMTFAMQEKVPHLKDATFEIFGRYKGKSFRNEFNAASDINGWYRNTVAWDELVGMNMQQKTQTAYEGVVAKLWDDVHAMEMVGIDDPIEMRQRIEAMLIAQAKMQAQVQQITGEGQPSSQAGGAPSPGQPSPSTPQSGSQGAPPPAMIQRPPALARQQSPGLITGVPRGVSRDAVAQLLARLGAKLKGQVFAVGDLADRGQAMHITLAITDGKDYNPVLQVVRALDPHAIVRRIAREKMPPEAVLVAG